ncbi:MAG: rubredoxin [Clostridia bacterium]|nr:rubredoxin [Clostridia bacterium]
MVYVCDVCGWTYDEDLGDEECGIEAGTRWEDIPEDFECPVCSVGKEEFSPEE